MNLLLVNIMFKVICVYVGSLLSLFKFFCAGSLCDFFAVVFVIVSTSASNVV